MAVPKRNDPAPSGAASPVDFSWSLCRGTMRIWLGGMLVSAGLFYVFNRQDFLMGMLFSALLVLMAVLDCRYLLIYDRLLLCLLLLGMIPWVSGRLSWPDACLGAALGGAWLGVLRLLVPQGMGWGDIKLAMVMGWWLGVTGICVALYIAFMSGGAYGLYLLLCRRLSRTAQVPFGPFLALGAVMALALSERCVDWLEAWLWW